MITLNDMARDLARHLRNETPLQERDELMEVARYAVSFAETEALQAADFADDEGFPEPHIPGDGIVEALARYLHRASGLSDTKALFAIVDEQIYNATAVAKEWAAEGNYDPREEALTAAARNEGRV